MFDLKFKVVFIPIYFSSKKKALDYISKFKLEENYEFVITRIRKNRYKVSKRYSNDIEGWC